MWQDMDGVINEQASVSNLLGISAGNSRLAGYEGQSLPASTYAGRDHAAVPWSPDSPLFWGGVVALATLLGFVGASGSVRVGKARASAEVND
jgi:hypothetical protein